MPGLVLYPLTCLCHPSLYHTHFATPPMPCPLAEEEISTMQKELEKYGINMPSFGKIGGILANEVQVWVFLDEIVVSCDCHVIR